MEVSLHGRVLGEAGGEGSAERYAFSLVSTINEPSKKLAEKGPQSHPRLRLDFRRNSNFTDESLKKLAEKVPQSLTLLSLEFHDNENFTDKSLKELAEGVP